MQVTYCVAEQDGRHKIRLTLPCFAGEKAAFFHAARMNRYYGQAMAVLWQSAANRSTATQDCVRSTCLCEACVEEADDAIVVTLTLTRRAHGMRPVSKTVVDRWRRGVLIRHTISIL